MRLLVRGSQAARRRLPSAPAAIRERARVDFSLPATPTSVHHYRLPTLPTFMSPPNRRHVLIDVYVQHVAINMISTMNWRCRRHRDACRLFIFACLRQFFTLVVDSMPRLSPTTLMSHRSRVIRHALITPRRPPTALSRHTQKAACRQVGGGRQVR